MKKTILISVITVFLLYSKGFAEITANVYSRSIDAGQAETTITLPATSHNLVVRNGSTTSVCVSPKGKTTGLEHNCDYGTSFLLDGDSSFELYEFHTDSVIIKTLWGGASPVTVISTW